MRKRQKQQKKSYHQITRGCSNNKTYCGYCHHQKHRGWLTVQVMSEHNCLEKECRFFEKCEHPLWTDESYMTKQINYKKLSRIKKYIKYPTKQPPIYLFVECNNDDIKDYAIKVPLLPQE